MFIVNVEGAIYHNNKWLLIKRGAAEEHAAGEIALVGGKAELEGASTEILERTLQREIFEEVGIKVKDLTYVNSSSFTTASRRAVIDIVFYCLIDSGTPYTKSTEEVEELMWLSTEEIENHESIQSYLKDNIRLAATVAKKNEDKMRERKYK